MSRKSMIFVVEGGKGGMAASGDMASLSKLDDLDDILSSLSTPVPTGPLKAVPTANGAPTSTPAQIKVKYHANEPTWQNAEAEKIHEEEVKGVIVRRIPLPAPSFQSKRTIPGYEMEMNNTRGHDVKVVVDFNGTNIRATPYPGFMLSSDMNTIEGVVPANTKKYVANVKPKSTDVEEFDGFDYNILVYPAQDLIREQTLEGVTLYTRISYGKVLTYEFSVHNQKDFNVEATVFVYANATGDLLPDYRDPFVVTVNRDEKKIVGTVNASGDIASRWQYKRIADSPDANKTRNIHKSEAEGVIMYQTHIVGKDNALELKLENTKDFGIKVIVKLVGGEIVGDRIFKLEVPATSTKTMDPIQFAGSVSVEWAWDSL